jgi:hypothetical protein
MCNMQAEKRKLKMIFWVLIFFATNSDSLKRTPTQVGTEQSPENKIWQMKVEQFSNYWLNMHFFHGLHYEPPVSRLIHPSNQRCHLHIAFAKPPMRKLERVVLFPDWMRARWMSCRPNPISASRPKAIKCFL